MTIDFRPTPPAGLPQGFQEELASVLSPAALIREPGLLEPYLLEERGLYAGHASLAVAPASRAELSAAVRVCAKFGVPMVAQGGNTGLVGGAVSASDEVVMSLGRMRAIREVDALNYTVTVEAGAILADVQAAAAAKGCLFPLSLGAEGSCTIGGNIASNAGGVGVLKYGNMRELVLGLEVVLPDGRIWNGMRPLYKDNSSYSLKNLFVGSEGTLGFVTAAILKLFPALSQKQTAFCALPDVESALSLLSLARRESGDQVTAFELVSDFAVQIVCDHAGGVFPLQMRAPWYALVELGSPRAGDDLRPVFEAMLETAFNDGLVLDAVVAERLDQAERLWHLRERTPEAQKRAGGSIKHDISVPVSAIPAFIAEAGAAVSTYMPGIHVCAFGHLGDGNVHYNLSQPAGMNKSEFLEHWDAISALVHPIAARMRGSISAEHGIGLLKTPEIRSYRSEVEQDLVVTLKKALDPFGLMNPGKFV